MRPLLLFGLWIGLVALACGCSYTQTCYSLEGVVNDSGVVLVFNKCTGAFYLDQLPRIPKSTPDTDIPNFHDDNPKTEL